MKLKTILGSFLLTIVSVIVVLFWVDSRSGYNQQVVKFGDNRQIIAEVADTPEQRSLGLSGRRDLGTERGMWFVFDRQDKHGIWMKDMQFAIDILWINEDLEVVHIKENATPQSYPKTFVSAAPAKYVLEVNAGIIKEDGVSVGDKLSLE